MKKTIILSIILITLIGILPQCSSDVQKGELMPTCTGKTGDLLLIMPDATYEGKTGDTVFATLTQPVMVLPQAEATFKVIHINKTQITNLIKKSRNVLETDINPQYQKPSITVEENKYARPQIYITLKAANDTALQNIFLKTANFIIDTITHAEQLRYYNFFNQNHESEAENQLKKKHNVKLMIPYGFSKDVDKQNFVWISKETSISSQGLLVFNYPYTGPKDFNLQNLIGKMDSILEKNVPGPEDGSFMTTSKKIEPIKKEYMRGKNYVCEIRGLWETQGDFMGGPYVSQSMVDTVNNQLITTFAYVYGGKNDKRNLLWQLEGIMNSFDIVYNQQ